MYSSVCACVHITLSNTVQLWRFFKVGVLTATADAVCSGSAGFSARCASPDLQQSPVDVVVLDVGSRVGRELLQQRADGGRHLRQQDKRDERPSRHLPGAIDRRATASANQAATETNG